MQTNDKGQKSIDYYYWDLLISIHSLNNNRKKYLRIQCNLLLILIKQFLCI